ncbi:MAG: hypothetical protein EOP39_09900 [Rubrivivax sp.]|nr:MAG: hypothetical protein EOP39_09900 [Rubrivivax sp.]
MPSARPVSPSPHLLLALLGLAAIPAHADIGATLSLQSDARERGVSYSDNRPGAQLGLSWDGAAGWYAGASLTRARFGSVAGGADGAWLRGYAGRVVELQPGLDGEAGIVLHRYPSGSRYDYAEAYVGLLGERWNARLHHAPDHYGSGQRATYGEFNLRWPLVDAVAAVGHVGVLRSHGEAHWPAQTYTGHHGPTRIDLRAGASWQWGERVEIQLTWVSVSRGGPAMWMTTARSRTVVLGLSSAF